MYTSQNRRASAGAPSAQCLHNVTFSLRIVGSARGFASTSRLTRLLEDQQRVHRPSKAQASASMSAASALASRWTGGERALDRRARERRPFWAALNTSTV